MRAGWFEGVLLASALCFLAFLGLSRDEPSLTQAIRIPRAVSTSALWKGHADKASDKTLFRHGHVFTTADQMLLQATGSSEMESLDSLEDGLQIPTTRQQLTTVSGNATTAGGNMTTANLQAGMVMVAMKTDIPTPLPTLAPSDGPTNLPSMAPSMEPSDPPTSIPTASPSFSPTPPPSASPSVSPTIVPSHTPSEPPTHLPTMLNQTFPKITSTSAVNQTQQYTEPNGTVVKVVVVTNTVMTNVTVVTKAPSSPAPTPPTESPTQFPTHMPSSPGPTARPSRVPTHKPTTHTPTTRLPTLFKKDSEWAKMGIMPPGQGRR